MNILVTGANGMLGNTIQLVAKDSKDHYIFTDVCDGYQKLDITNLEDIRREVKENIKKGILIAVEGPNVVVPETAAKFEKHRMPTAQENLPRV